MHPNVKRLLEKEYDEQRSEAWLKLRGNMLTASDCSFGDWGKQIPNPRGPSPQKVWNW